MKHGRWQCNLLVWWMLHIMVIFFPAAHCWLQRRMKEEVKPWVRLDVQKKQVVMNNDILSATISVPDGLVTSISYQGVDNLLETLNEEGNRGYWDVVWDSGENKGIYDRLEATSFEVIKQNENQIEISFKREWDPSQSSSGFPCSFDRRFVMLSGSPGFYTYAIFKRLEKWPWLSIAVARVVFKLRQDLFHYMAISDDRQRMMPMPQDRVRGQVLDYPEAVLLTNPTDPLLKGEVDDKYFYSSDNKDNMVHGWVGRTDPPVGFWMITPSNEFRAGGPLKQDLTSHCGPTVLSVFACGHYAGKDLHINFQDGEPWKMVFGPIFVYLNSHASAANNPSILWNDAKKRMYQEVGKWPYSFPVSQDYVKPDQRGTVSGRLFVHDWFVDKHPVLASYAYVGLALPGDPGSWQRGTKGYQFWTQTDKEGNFVIKGVIPGTHNLYATVHGRFGDYKYASDIKMKPGQDIELGDLVFEPPRNGATLWEIGIADRTAAEFYIPDADSMFKLHKFNDKRENKFRQYGLWRRYAELYPNKDLVYTVGKSDYSKDWFFAHVNRNSGNGTFLATTWQIVFELESVNRAAHYTLQLALASAERANLQVRFNDEGVQHPHFTTGPIGDDNAIARHGIHGLYWPYSIRVPGTWLVRGSNAIYLKQAGAAGSPFRGLMYDYIRFEGPDR